MAPTGKEESALKQHRFWAWAAVICMVMVMVTGYKRCCFKALSSLTVGAIGSLHIVKL